MSNPRYNNTLLGEDLVGVPPFTLDGVVVRAFPLRANMRALTRFCNLYLNIMPEEVAVFRPASSFVMLSAINYGRMRPETSNLGWVAQNEVVFSVFLERYRREPNGQLAFQDWATVSPFIFVDDELSLAIGREVYGWPKHLAWLTPGINEWTRHPERPQGLFQLSTMVFPELFAGQRQEPRVLLEIEQAPAPSMSRFPVDPATPLNPMVSLPRAMIEGASIVGELWQAVMGLPLQGYPTDRNAAAMPAMAARAMDYLNILSRLPVANTVNLKQFRDARDKNAACYQAITTAPMTVARFEGGALLGDMTQLRGDPSGGFSIKVHRYPTQPIIESLGLEVTSEVQADDHSIATLSTLLPFWVSLDFEYGRGELLCWRTSELSWRTGSGDDEPAPPSASVKHPYNTARGTATEAVTGPFLFPNVTQRVLPLLADWFRLKKLCADYLDNDFTFFEPWGSYVYLIVTTFEEMSSETYNVGWWANRQVTFSFPVKWYKRSEVRSPEGAGEANRGELISTALFTPFAYTDSELSATTGREVQGLRIVKADIESPRSAWLEEHGPVRRSDMLRLRTNVYSAFAAGQTGREQVLMEITPGDMLPSHDEAGWEAIAGDWGERLYGEVFRRYKLRSETALEFEGLRSLALELLRGKGQPINEISLRQFRDVREPNEACYQAITHTATTIEELYELSEIEERVHVAMHRYPSHGVVETLGLRVKRTDASGSSVVDYLEPVRPFWMKLAMRVDLGEDVFWRAGSEAWVSNSPEWHRPLEELRRAGPDVERRIEGRLDPRNLYFVDWNPSVGRRLAATIDETDELKKALRGAWRHWRYSRDNGAQLLDLQEARTAMGVESDELAERTAPPRLIEPQFIIESLLSNEWGRRHEPRGGEHKLPEIFLRSDSLGHPGIRDEYRKTFNFDESGGRFFKSSWEERLREGKREQ